MTTMTTMTTTPTRALLTALAFAALPGAALAQDEITIDVENPTLRPGESTRVTLFAGFDPTYYAMAGVATNLVTSVGSEGLGNATLVVPMTGPGTSAGAASATGWDGIIAGQIQDGLHYYADTTNPIAFWQATYTAPIDASAPFDIDLSTLTTAYHAYLHRHSGSSESRLAELVEGSATIHVIPAPASALVLAGGLLAMRRRR